MNRGLQGDAAGASGPAPLSEQTTDVPPAEAIVSATNTVCKSCAHSFSPEGLPWGQFLANGQGDCRGASALRAHAEPMTQAADVPPAEAVSVCRRQVCKCPLACSSQRRPPRKAPPQAGSVLHLMWSERRQSIICSYQCTVGSLVRQTAHVPPQGAARMLPSGRARPTRTTHTNVYVQPTSGRSHSPTSPPCPMPGAANRRRPHAVARATHEDCVACPRCGLLGAWMHCSAHAPTARCAWVFMWSK